MIGWRDQEGLRLLNQYRSRIKTERYGKISQVRTDDSVCTYPKILVVCIDSEEVQRGLILSRFKLATIYGDYGNTSRSQPQY